MSTNLEQELLEHGIKPSPQRVMVYRALLGRVDHPSADVLFRELKAQMPTLSKTTVYSTLSLLIKAHLVRDVSANSDQQRVDPDTSFHAHFKCEKCGEIFDIRVDGMPSPKFPDGFVTDREQLLYYGTCAKCNKSKG